MTALADLRALLAAATPPPWTVDHDVRPTELSYVRVNGHLRAELDGRRLLNERADAELIVAAVNSLPHLIAVAEAAEDAAFILNEHLHLGKPLVREMLYAVHDGLRAALSVLDEQEPR